jgi:hypothetical protein
MYIKLSTSSGARANPKEVESSSKQQKLPLSQNELLLSLQLKQQYLGL